MHIALPVALSTSCGCRKSGAVPRRHARTLDGVYKIQTMSADCAITIQFEVVPLGSTNSDALPEHDVSTRHKQNRQKKQNRPNCRKDIRFYCFQQWLLFEFFPYAQPFSAMRLWLGFFFCLRLSVNARLQAAPYGNTLKGVRFRADIHVSVPNRAAVCRTGRDGTVDGAVQGPGVCNLMKKNAFSCATCVSVRCEGANAQGRWFLCSLAWFMLFGPWQCETVGVVRLAWRRCRLSYWLFEQSEQTKKNLQMGTLFDSRVFLALCKRGRWLIALIKSSFITVDNSMYWSFL